ncbi:MAG: hypothetical protein COW84_06570 [Gammaproteobacteria bacterium CG22_combo_CG10-13_8_21_14_all_40_8]|nr:MAG: hypothetical protein COW84_06570 [Gammaproteobacteria bacterium CG22_combo_CG10-13_8_21_14_all_40_8]
MSKLKLTSIAIFSALLFSACSNMPAEKPKAKIAKADSSRADLVCFKTQRVGSHMQNKRCITKSQAEEEKRAVQKELNHITHQNSKIKDKG